MTNVIISFFVSFPSSPFSAGWACQHLREAFKRSLERLNVQISEKKRLPGHVVKPCKHCNPNRGVVKVRLQLEQANDTKKGPTGQICIEVAYL